jgi:hypothetical protein
MELDGYVDRLRTEFAAISEVAGEDVREVAERLVAPLESAVRLVLLEALAAAADEITLDLVPGSVHLRLRASEPDFVVTTAAASAPAPPGPAPVAPPVAPSSTDPDGGPVARINFRPPESLKNRIEEAAGRDGLSVNTWLTRVATAALDQPAAPAPHLSPGPRSRVGWFG